MPSKLKIAYFGSDFLSLSLEALLSRSDVRVEAVFSSTRPGHAKVNTLARHTKLITSKVGKAQHGQLLSEMDVLLSVGYSWRIPTETCRFAVNMHPALLPLCRGPTPVPWVLFDYPHAAGVSLHVMNEKFDDGPLISSRKIESADRLSFYGYIMMCNQLGSELVMSFLDDPVSEILGARQQDRAQACYMPKFPDLRRMISMEMKGEDIVRTIRRLGPDGALLKTEGGQMKVTGGEFIPDVQKRPHMKLEINSVYAALKCIDGFVLFRWGEFTRV